MTAARLMIDVSGKTLSDGDIRRLRRKAVGGVILFSRNFESAMQLRNLTAEIHRHAGRRLLVAADHEGGRVQRFRGDGFSSLPPMGAVGEIDGEKESAQAAFDCGFAAAGELRLAGVDFNFAPVLDLNLGESKIIGDRAFGSDPGRVAKLAGAFADGMSAAGMSHCGKHFPGHGGVRADSHLASPEDSRGYDELAAADIMPFTEFFRRPMPAMMTAHIRYSKVDSAPATFSPKWLGEILRHRLRFGGLVISDDLAMAGAKFGDESEAFRVRKALAAGCDLTLLCNSSAPDGDEFWRETEEIPQIKFGGEKNPWLSLLPNGEIDPAKISAASDRVNRRWN